MTDDNVSSLASSSSLSVDRVTRVLDTVKPSVTKATTTTTLEQLLAKCVLCLDTLENVSDVRADQLLRFVCETPALRKHQVFAGVTLPCDGGSAAVAGEGQPPVEKRGAAAQEASSDKQEASVQEQEKPAAPLPSVAVEPPSAAETATQAAELGVIATAAAALLLMDARADALGRYLCSYDTPTTVEEAMGKFCRARARACARGK